jgi:hypothetical protein
VKPYPGKEPSPLQFHEAVLARWTVETLAQTGNRARYCWSLLRNTNSKQRVSERHVILGTNCCDEGHWLAVGGRRVCN